MRDLSNDRFVAHIDILGMSSIVERDPNEAWEMLSALANARDVATNTTLQFVDRAEQLHVPEHVKAVTFSDTILLYTRHATDNDLRTLIVTVLQIFSNALHQRVPIRVGIALGVFFINEEKSMYMGPALIDAYRIGESAQWLGVVFSPSLQGRERHLNMRSENADVVLEWPVPLKSGAMTLSVANWPVVMRGSYIGPSPITTDQFYKIFEPTFGPLNELPPDVVAKYENTVAFLSAQYGFSVPPSRR